MPTDVMQFLVSIHARQYCLSEAGNQHQCEWEQNSRALEVFHRVHKAPAAVMPVRLGANLQFMFAVLQKGVLIFVQHTSLRLTGT